MTYPIDAWEWPRIAVFVPLTPAMPYADEVFPHFIEIARTGVRFFYHPYGSTDSVRNRIAETLLLSDYTHILYLDSDQKHLPDIVVRMAKWVIEDRNRLVVAGLYFNRREPFLPLAWVKGEDGHYYQIHKWGRGLIRGVDLVGSGCMLVSRCVFGMIERPWFFYDYEGAQEKKTDFVYPTEDIGFCKKVRAAGIEIYLDTTIVSPHARPGWVTEEHYRLYCAAHDAEEKDEITDVERVAPRLAE